MALSGMRRREGGVDHRATYVVTDIQSEHVRPVSEPERLGAETAPVRNLRCGLRVFRVWTVWFWGWTLIQIILVSAASGMLDHRDHLAGADGAL